MSLGEIWTCLWRSKRLLLVGWLLGAALGITVGLLSRPVYRATALLASAPSTKGGALSALAGQFGGLADLSGLSMGGEQEVEYSIAIMQSEEFLERFIADEGLLKVLFADEWDPVRQRWGGNGVSGFAAFSQKYLGAPSTDGPPGAGPSVWRGYKRLAPLIDIRRDKRTQIITVAVDWRDPVIAARWANRLPQRLNEEARRRAIDQSERSLQYVDEQLAKTNVVEVRTALFRLAESAHRSAMSARVAADSAFRVLAPAVVPQERIAPKRAYIAIAGSMLGLMLACVYALSRRTPRMGDRA